MEYDVHLDTFEGPLDLLLHLVRKTDLEIKEIQISEITAEYISYLETMQNLNLDIAGDFLVMASALMQIKAKMLHPDNEKEEADADAELDKIKAKLLEYQKYKEVSKILAAKEQQYSRTYYRPRPVIEDKDYQLDATIFDLVKSFQDALRTLPEEVREIMYKEIPIELKIREILDILEGKQYVSFNDILKMQHSRTAMVVCFMAVLELVKNKQILARQSELFEDIRIYRNYNSEAEDNNTGSGETNEELNLSDETENYDEHVQQSVQPESLVLEQEDENSEIQTDTDESVNDINNAGDENGN